METGIAPGVFANESTICLKAELNELAICCFHGDEGVAIIEGRNILLNNFPLNYGGHSS